MRPHKLTLNQFGSFSRETAIDFSSFDSLFLISGNTGSGKTTIFDGLMYALYGLVPGSREKQGLVSAHVEIENPYVCLDFFMGSERYRVTRELGHVRKKKRGTGFTEVSEKVSLELYIDSEFQEEVGQNRSATDLRIKEIVGLEADEFEKIVLIPQGQFERFLQADSNEKFELLSRLFPVEKYKYVAELFKEKRNQNRRDTENRSRDLEQLLKSFDPRSYKETLREMEEVIELKNREIELRQKELRTLYSEIEKAKERELKVRELQSVEEKLALHAHKKNEIEEKRATIDKARLVLPLKPYNDEKERIGAEISQLKRRLKDKQKEKSVIEEELLRLAGEMEKVLAYKEDVEDKKALLLKLEELRPAIEEREAARLTIKKLEADIEALDKKRDAAEAQKRSLIEKIDAAEKGVFEKQKLIEKRSALLEQIPLLSKAVQSQNDRDALQKEQEELKGALKKSETEEKGIEKELDGCQKEVAGLLEKQKSYSAALLAATLTEGKACPVCGSLDHPTPLLHRESDAFDEKKLRDAEKNVTLLSQKLYGMVERNKHYREGIEKLSDKLSLLPQVDSDSRQKLDVLQKEESATAASLNKYKNSDKLLSDLKSEKEKLEENNEIQTKEHHLLSTEIAVVREKFTQLDKRLEGIESLKELSDKTAQLKDYTERYTRKVDELTAKTDDFRQKKSSADVLIAELGEQEEAQNKRSLEIACLLEEKSREFGFEISDQYFLDEKIVEKLSEEIKFYEDESIRLNEKLSSLKKEVGGLTFDSTGLSEKYKAGEALLKEDLKAKEDIIAKRTLLLELSERYTVVIGELEELKKKSEELSSIADELNGKNSKNINFYSYVMASYLDKIIFQANIRLKHLSNGQYEFIRRDEKEKGQTRSGLELDIVDIFGGVVRKVQSLSGGEKFLASLSLALGLTDVVRYLSGGFKIESLFIDEGFGSLDEGSLERAIEILDEIREERLTGLISHVSWLKERIPDQLEIKKVNGSSVVIR
jgi:exonuclease SbcC